MTVTDRYLHYLAVEIDRYGFRAVEAELPAVIGDARRADISAIVLSVLADPGEPEITRARAFGHVASRLALREKRRAEASLVAATP